VKDPERLFEVEVVEEVVKHPPQVMQVADRLHDMGMVEEADKLLDASAELIHLYDMYSEVTGVCGCEQRTEMANFL